jgi:hypothetical protein
MLVSRSLLRTNAGKRLNLRRAPPRTTQPIYQGERAGNSLALAPVAQARAEKKYFNTRALRSEYPNQVTMSANRGHIRCG